MAGRRQEGTHIQYREPTHRIRVQVQVHVHMLCTRRWRRDERRPQQQSRGEERRTPKRTQRSSLPQILLTYNNSAYLFRPSWSRFHKNNNLRTVPPIVENKSHRTTTLRSTHAHSFKKKFQLVQKTTLCSMAQVTLGRTSTGVGCTDYEIPLSYPFPPYTLLG